MSAPLGADNMLPVSPAHYLASASASASASARALPRLRQRIFDYPASREAQAARVLRGLKTRALRDRAAALAQAPRGPYSGLSAAELRRTGTVEADWY